MQRLLSLLFTYPLETTIVNSTPSLEKHNIVQSNHPIVPQNYQIDLDQQYADYISKISSFRNMLQRKLIMNTSKTSPTSTHKMTLKEEN